MPLRLTMLAYPAFAVALQMSRPNAAAAFERAGATSARTARRPESLEIPRKRARRAIEQGLLVPTGDGRFYLDLEVARRRDRRSAFLLVGSLLLTIPMIWLMW